MKKLLFLIITLIAANLIIAGNPVIKTGIEVLKDTDFKILKGKKVGLITNPTGMDNNFKSTVDILHEAENVELVALFGPEHGVRGDYEAGEKVKFYTDEKTGVPVYSLYGKTRKPNEEMLKSIDALVYDIQDNGCRSYTYISTMGVAMEAAAEHNIEFIVLDRPNPLGGEKVEGNLVEDGFISFVSQFKIPYIYGLTCGELAEMLNNEKMLENGVKCNLKVVGMEGWKRDMTFVDTGLEWIPTSPHLPYMESPFYYPATGILGELYVVSIGVGYTVPFRTFAAPWIDAYDISERMNSLNLAGVKFRPVSYVPYYSVSKGEKVNGVQIHIIDYSKVNLTEIQFYFLQEHNKLYPEKDIFEMRQNRFGMFDKVCGTDKIRKMFTENYLYEDVKGYWEKDVDEFRKLSKKYFMYE
ncbi:MAG: DUF1343 domain-containing protein [Ignavibacteriae bacterium]|nr:DUF1343 domain-containing protein [Ignavibacteriota bacterium]NOG99126.1 DUF1343 domain-containing protein [Ignavibacteriota bacterium]